MLTIGHKNIITKALDRDVRMHKSKIKQLEDALTRSKKQIGINTTKADIKHLETLIQKEIIKLNNVLLTMNAIDKL